MSILDLLKSHIVPTDGERLDKLRHELKLAESLRNQAYLSIGDAAASGVPTAEATAAYEKTVKEVLHLKAGIETLQTRIAETVEQTKASDREAKRQTLRDALAEVQRTTKALQDIFDQLRARTIEFDRALESAGAASRTLGTDQVANKLVQGKFSFDFYLKHSAPGMPNCGTPFVETLVPFSERFPNPNEVR